MNATEARLVQHGCALLLAVAFWGSFRFSRVTKGAFAVTRWAHLIMALCGLVLVAIVYTHPFAAVFGASLILPLLGQNHFRASAAQALGAETYQERLLEFVKVAGPGAYLRAAAANSALWLAFGVILLVASGGSRSLLYWVATGFIAAQMIGFMSSVQMAMRARPLDQKESGGGGSS